MPETDHIQELIEIYRRCLQFLEKRKALEGQKPSLFLLPIVRTK